VGSIFSTLNMPLQSVTAACGSSFGSPEPFWMGTDRTLLVFRLLWFGLARVVGVDVANQRGPFVFTPHEAARWFDAAW
jgi:hypothetical protein